MHSRTATTTAVAIFITTVVLRASSRGELPLLVLLSLSRVATLRVGELMLEVRLAAVHSRFVHANFELAGSRDRHVATSMVVFVEGVKVVAGIVLCTFGSFDQRVDYNNQQDEDP